MDLWLVSKLVVLLVIANASPVVASLVLGKRWDQRLDGGYTLPDQQPLLGASKTIRGLVASILVTAALAPVFGLSILQGAGFGLLAMLGDLGSSFIKRRLGLASSHSVPLLDQLPETLLPLLAMQTALPASAPEIAAAVAVFIVLDLVLSRLPGKIRQRLSDAG